MTKLLLDLSQDRGCASTVLFLIISMNKFSSLSELIPTPTKLPSTRLLRDSAFHFNLWQHSDEYKRLLCFSAEKMGSYLHEVSQECEPAQPAANHSN